MKKISLFLNRQPQDEQPQDERILWLSGEEMGEGKTERAIKEIAKMMQTRPNSKILILLPDHKACESVVERLALEGIYAKHLHGWEKKCPRYLSRDPEIIRLYAKKQRNQYKKDTLKRPLSIQQICGICGREEDCTYRGSFQFEDGDVAVAPQSFLHTPIVRIMDWSEIYVDDIDILSHIILPFIGDLDKIFHVLANRYAFTVMRELGVKSKSFYKLSNYEFRSIITEIRSKSSNFYNDLLENGELYNWLFNNKKKIRKYRYVLINPDIDSYEYYWTVRNIYKWKIPRVAYLNLFALLNKLETTKITMIGRQTPARESLLEAVLKKYEKEFNTCIKTENLSIVTNPNKPPKGMLYHLCPESRAPRTTLRRDDRKSTRERWDMIISKFMEDYQKKGMNINRIGTIIFKEFGNKKWLKKEFLLIFKQFKLKDMEILTYGNLRGLNDFEKVDFAIIFGAYNVNHRELIFDHNLIFLEKRQQVDLSKIKPLGNERKGFYYDTEKHPTLEDFREYQEWDEITQAIGRSVMRGINTVIIGDVPNYLIKSIGGNYKVLTYARNHRKKTKTYVNTISYEHKILKFLFDYYLHNGKSKITFKEIHELLQKEGFYVKKNYRWFFDDLKKLADASKWFSYKALSEGKKGRPKVWLTFTVPKRS